MKRSTEDLLWTLVTWLAVVGIIGGTIWYATYLGWWRGLLMSGLMCALGWMSVNVLYPLWFGDR